MGFLDTVKKLFKRDSFNTNSQEFGAARNHSVLRNKISINPRKQVIDYKEAEYVLSDPIVHQAFYYMSYILSSKQWSLVADPNDENNERLEFITEMLNNMDREINDIVQEILLGVMFGFNCHEIIYTTKDDKVIVKNLVPIDPKTLMNPFNYDDNGDLVSIHQEYGSEAADIPIDKILKYTYRKKFDNDFGYGLIRDFKPIVDAKKDIEDFYLTFLMRHASPTLYAKVNNPITKEHMLEAFDDVFAGTTGLVVGQDEDIGSIGGNGNGDVFINALSYYDAQIFKLFFISDLLSGNGNSSTGSYAQAQTQMQFTQKIYDGILDDIANTIQAQIIDRVIALNYSDVKGNEIDTNISSPRFVFDKFEAIDFKELFEILGGVIDKGGIDPDNESYKDLLAMLFKTKAGLDYKPDTVEYDASIFDAKNNPSLEEYDVTDAENGQTNILEMFDDIGG